MTSPGPTRSFAADDERFRQRYQTSGDAAILAVETAALGSDYGANGYTTMAQADELLRELNPTRHDLVVDLGAGCGWPGLYLASRSGCSVVSIDPVREGMTTASRRAVADGYRDRAWAIVGDAEHIPLRPGSVDAVVHADLIC